jgi:hypothetical protein
MIRLTVHAAGELERIEHDLAPGEINLYDCRNCRANPELLGSRVCMFDTERALVARICPETGVRVTYSVDRELLVALQDETPASPMQDFGRWQSVDGKEICFVPMISQPALRLLAQETDAREYGWQSLSASPNHARRTNAFRLIRSERAAVQQENDKRRKQDPPQGRIRKPGR